MKSSIANSLLLCILLASAATTCSAFAPVVKTSSSLSRTTAQKLSVSDFSLLISDAADAVLSTASDVADSVADVATTTDASSTSSSFEPTGFNPTYSKASYYTTLALYVASFPGLWSQIKRSTKAKVKRKTYVSDGEMTGGGKPQRQQAGEIMACEYRFMCNIIYVQYIFIGRLFERSLLPNNIFSILCCPKPPTNHQSYTHNTN
jgi:hypothetical protein